MLQSVINFYDLPRSTGGCDGGPIVERHPEELTVKYDDCDVWVTIKFEAPLAYRFIPDVAISELHLKAYSKLATVEHSEWLEELRAAADPEYSISEDFRHFMIYFDHHGCLEIIGQSYEIIS